MDVGLGGVVHLGDAAATASAPVSKKDWKKVYLLDIEVPKYLP